MESLSKSISINAPAAKVWQALTDPTIVKQYFFGTNVRSDWKKGGKIIWEGEWEGEGSYLPGYRHHIGYWTRVSF